MISRTDVDHFGFTVSNMERSLEFYRDILGFQVIGEAAISADEEWAARIVGHYGQPGAVYRIVYLDAGGEKIELEEYTYPEGRPMDRRVWDVGHAHICFQVDDVHRIYDELTARGIASKSEVQEARLNGKLVSYSVYVLDPDGISIELSQIVE
ncbi:MAG: VOC family protein [Chloroflexi bacterium]|nr:VOC family protein [Chloroflexota bacterium]